MKPIKESTLLISVSACLAWLAALTPAQTKSTPGLTPNEGTIGTRFTISGSGFGAKQGVVFIDQVPCKVLAWSDAAIACEIKVPRPPGAYDVALKPQGGGAWVWLPETFAIRPPMIDIDPTLPSPPGYLLSFVSPGDIINLTGKFFGAMGFLRVEIEDLQGQTRPCKVLSAAMESITFQLPSGCIGMFHLRISNLVGSAFLPFWGTFEPIEPPEPPPGNSQMLDIVTEDIAAAVFYHNQLWYFYPRKDNQQLEYVIWYGTNFFNNSAYSAETLLKTTNNVVPKSFATVTPVVVDDYLYVFFTDPSSNICYVVYNPLPSDPALRWQPAQSVPGAKASGKNEVVAAVHNYTANRLELYWTPDNTNVCMKTCNLDTGEWSSQNTVSIYMSGPSIAPYLTAVFNQLGSNDYVTYLSWDDRASGWLGECKDGTVQRYCGSSSWQSNNQNRGPSLADLGEDYLAVIYNHTGKNAYYVKYDKATHALAGTAIQVPASSYYACGKAPNGVVASSKGEDSTSPTGYRVTSTFYVLVGENPWYVSNDKWHVVQCEELGYWKPTSTGEIADWGTGEEMLTNSFPYWPILGIIDMAPFALNGYEKACFAPMACACSKADLSFEVAHSTGMSIEASVGAYFETSRASRIVADAGAGYTGGFESSTTYSYVTTAGIDANKEGRVLAFYAAPVFKIYDLQWYTNGQPTELHTTASELVSIQVRTEAFTPDVGPVWAMALPYPYLDPAVFPMHAAEDDTERLATYQLVDPRNYPYAFTGSATESLDAPIPFGWKISAEQNVDNGWYVKFKVGVKFPRKLGFGAEGEFTMRFSSKTEADVEAMINMVTSDPAAGFDKPIIEFHVNGYWLKPNAAGYWVPRNRQGMGDTPWFITYLVTDWYPHYSE